MAQQGFPPGRHSREPEARPQGGYDALYADEASHQDEHPYQGSDPYREAGQDPGEAGYQSEYPGQAQGPGQAQYQGDAGLAGDQRYGGGPRYQDEPGYRSEPDRGSLPGYQDEPGYRPDSGYASDSGYRPDSGYQPEPGYRTGSGYRPDPAYPDEPGHRDQSSYGGQQTGYETQASYRSEPGYVDQHADVAAAPVGHPQEQSRPGRSTRPDRHSRVDRSRHQDRQRPERDAWQHLDPFASDPDTDSNLPPWAGPAPYPRQAAAVRQPPRTMLHRDADTDVAAVDVASEPDLQPEAPDRAERIGLRRGRAAATRLRKSRRRVFRWGVFAIVVCIVGAGVAAIVTHHTPKPALYVTSLQSGEFKSVPSACSSVSTTLLNQYLPGTGRTTTGNLSSTTESQCSFTIDAKPNFLVLEIQAQAYQPFAAAAGDGSASGNAQDNFALAQQQLAHPPKKSPVPAAQISKLTGIGQQAFLAFQNEHVSGIITDVVTVVIRQRNVVITAIMSGQESGHGFGPVPVATLTAGATAAAKSMLAKVEAQPTA